MAQECSKTILVTGGTGFIGSHTCVQLIEQGYDVAILDNLCNSKLEVLNRIERITGVRPRFYEVDIRDREGLDHVFEAEPDASCVIHFAGLKAVGESSAKPWMYYENNVTGSLVLFDAMAAHGCKSIIFSSSATVYGAIEFTPITEDMPKHTPTNPYGKTKDMLEEILTDMATADSEWNVVLLRYFNPIGAHPSGLMGEDPNGIPNNLMPYITQVACGKREELGVFGDDYPTPDGTGMRDYIHVMDLADGHVAALRYMEGRHGTAIFNLGTGTPYSVFDVVHAFEKANDLTIPYRVKARRDGDLACYYANPSKAEREMGWKTKLELEDMCRDSWHWQSMNPDGYGEDA